MTPVLHDVLSMAFTDRPAPKPAYLPTLRRSITRRGILWLGQTCNLRCHFCYFLDRITDDAHPEHGFMSLDKAKQICRTLVDYYGNNSLDIQGGEPTLWPHLAELVRFNASIGLDSTIISNGQVLSNRAAVAKLRDAGLRDVLFSLQGLGDIYDEIVGQKGAGERQMKALRNMQEEGLPFRLNTVLSRPVLAQLDDIATLAIRTGAEVVNFLGFNPFNDQTTGKRSSVNVPSYSELAAPLNAALDRLTAAGVETNVRYLPLCIVAERHRETVYDFPQIPYDLHENDFASWSWTDQPAQRQTHTPLTEPFPLGHRLQLGALRGPLRKLAKELPRLGNGLYQIKDKLEKRWATSPAQPARSRDELYREDARMRAEEYTGYRHVTACSGCDVRAICDGFYGDYADLFGEGEARPIRLANGAVSDPQHFTRNQQKRVHPQDIAWLDGAANS